MKIMLQFFFYFVLCLTVSSDAKILIFTYSYNRPDFIEIQCKTFKKFLADDYEFIVFNDATDENMCSQIEQMCQKLKISCVKIPQEIHDPEYNASVRNCRVVQYSLDLIDHWHNDIVVLIDSDMFLVRPFSVKDYLKGYDLAGWPQLRNDINYLWIGLVFLNMATMPNPGTIRFDCGWIGNAIVDSGGFSHYYLKNNPEARIRYLEDVFYLKDFFCEKCLENRNEKCKHHLEQMQQLEFSNPLIELASQSGNSNMEVYLKNTFLHYRAGSNWSCDSSDYHNYKTKLLNRFIEDILV